MTAGQLELPLFEVAASVHGGLMRWDPIGKPDGTYTFTCDCGEVQVTHSWAGQEVAFLEHCRGDT